MLPFDCSIRHLSSQQQQLPVLQQQQLLLLLLLLLLQQLSLPQRLLLLPLQLQLKYGEQKGTPRRSRVSWRCKP